MTRPAAALTAVAAAAVLLAGCRSDDAGIAPQQPSDAPSLARAAAASGGATRLTAEIVNSAGDVIGDARLTEDATGTVHLTVHVKGLTPGLHGLHVHAVGSCVGPTFTSAGGHYNPASRQHGHLNPLGYHAGDLPNLIVNGAGVGHLSANVDQFSLAALQDADGSALVIHANQDDYRTDPTGNSGARIACGVLE
ncbi:superoxide dismutase family protein [Roseisolibacter agri]|uniref:Superoxide dismutase n=1 Tax=Roseisolibacter agri TaxID=2014610 RepID=A0AA37Q8A6_9BACT|nr:superoxide dismutase family protein [Roseisolibacter agri]GLC24856.1 superoxide dismutase [Roseisolibacter agri]